MKYKRIYDLSIAELKKNFRDVNAPDWMKYGIMILLVCIGGFFLMQAI
jgi:hypothetical protein